MKHSLSTRILSTTVLCLAVGFATAGCSGSDSSSAATAAAGQQPVQTAGGGAPSGSGKVTDVSGSTVQVQGQGAQVAVSWTDATTFTQQVKASLSDVAVGSCVMVTSGEAGTGSLTAITAATVWITEAADDSCTAMGGLPGGDGGQGDGALAGGGEAPGGTRPTDMPSGAPGGGPRGGFAVGEVTAVSSSGFTVASQQTGSTAAATTKIAVTTAAATTYTTTAKATASDIRVGVCVTSRGDADDTGALTATSIGITPAVDGECATGFGGGRPAAQS